MANSTMRTALDLPTLRQWAEASAHGFVVSMTPPRWGARKMVRSQAFVNYTEAVVDTYYPYISP